MRQIPALLGLFLALGLAACSSTSDTGPSSPSAQLPAGNYKLGPPYKIKGRWYYPEYDPTYDKVGVASWYGGYFHGRDTANGETFDKRQITAAHKTMPLPSIVRVTNLENGRTIDVRVNDRGPFVDDRLIDLSEAAAARLGFHDDGLARVRVQFIQLAPAHGTPPRPSAPRVEYAAVAPTPAPVAIPRRPAPVQVFDPSPQVVAVQPARAVAPRQPVRVAAAQPSRMCPAGPRYVRIFGIPDGTAMAEVRHVVADAGPMVVEPIFGAGKPEARVRVGPVDDAEAAAALLDRIQALGYRDAVMTATPAPGASPLAC